MVLTWNKVNKLILTHRNKNYQTFSVGCCKAGKLGEIEENYGNVEM